jgi:C1A family cysteine protease
LRPRRVGKAVALLTGLASGWIPDPPDPRDYAVDHPLVRPFIELAGVAVAPPALPASVDLRPFFPAVIDQGPLHSCTAATTAALVSYFQRKAHGRTFEPSLLFLYKVTRNLLRLQGDSGALLRATMQALRLFGVTPEDRWPSVAQNLDLEPLPFHYAIAANYKAKTYYRLDRPGLARNALLDRVRTNLAAQLPSMFGLFTFPSLALAMQTGDVPLPSRGERPELSHALVAVGYDDDFEIRNPIDAGVTRGALRIRNSWGPSWGDTGYGWLPYAYLLAGLTSDWWSLVEADFVDSGQFGVQQT